MELNSGECAILAMPNEVYLFVFVCPDCNSSSQSYKVKKEFADYLQTRGVKLFNVPNLQDLNKTSIISLRCAICGKVSVDSKNCTIEDDVFGETHLCAICPNCSTEIKEPISGSRKEEFVRFLKQIGVNSKTKTTLDCSPITEQEIRNFAAQLVDEKLDIIEELNKIR